ncbi:MAG: Na+/H+ antiporter NhaC family protein [Verrucomicrobiota bacterium]
MKAQAGLAPWWRLAIVCGIGFLLAWPLALWETGFSLFYPTLVALLVVFLTRSAFVGLLTGALSGSALLAEGNLFEAISVLWGDQFLPIFGSEWKISALVFTLVLGGFVALVEAGGGLQMLIYRLLGKGRAPAKRMQLTVFGFGLLVFFDGLANTMMIGRMLRSAADRCGVSRVKLAYLADTTGSAVACLAFISTWIAFQLSMIRQGYEAVGQEVSAYGLFFKSMPMNFYCWFALILAVVCVLRNFNPGLMGRREAEARKGLELATTEDAPATGSHWLLAILPIGVLTLSIPVASYVIGAETLWPISLSKFAAAYGAAENYVPRILMGSSALAAIVAAVACLLRNQRSDSEKIAIASVFFGGVRDLLKPIAILLAAWMLGAAISLLGVADLLGGLLEGRLPIGFLPAVIFFLGALISFSTGTSWGTMGVLMPLAIPVTFALAGGSEMGDVEPYIVAAIGAVFSGAVFGDHCSPFSDTTIVASIAAGIEPMEHFWTQLPFAILAAAVAALVGFVPLGFGVSVWVCLALGSLLLFGLSFLFSRN